MLAVADKNGDGYVLLLIYKKIQSLLDVVVSDNTVKGTGEK